MRARILSVTLLFLFVVAIFYTVEKSLPEENKVKKIVSSQVTLIEIPKIRIIYVDPQTPEDIVPIECDGVTPVTYRRAVSLASLSPEERKKKFIDFLLPSVLIVNYEVRYTRENLIRILEKLRGGLKLTREEVNFVESILDRCRSDSIEEALVKANPVPPSLVIAQAAIESGWGTSRFFVEGNNPFGIWTFKRDEDSIPSLGGKASLRKFDTILDAVREYIYNVNVGWAYEGFRKHRLKTFDPLSLSRFLDFYSIEREMYVRKIRRIIRENDLERLDLCALDPSYLR